MRSFTPTIPALCPFTSLIHTCTPFTAVLPDLTTPLDLRPAGMDWSYVHESLSGCPECQECIGSGKTIPGVTGSALASDTTTLHGRFWSVIDGARDNGDLLSAMIIALHASWWSDDQGLTPSSREFRMHAVESARTWHEMGNQLCSVPGLDEVLITDLLRRSCNFLHVSDIAMAGLAKAPDPLIARALAFQMRKAATWDTLCYRFDLTPVDRK